jgi:peptidoglycan-N-acetylglucosamine deacetylase
MNVHADIGVSRERNMGVLGKIGVMAVLAALLAGCSPGSPSAGPVAPEASQIPAPAALTVSDAPAGEGEAAAAPAIEPIVVQPAEDFAPAAPEPAAAEPAAAPDAAADPAPAPAAAIEDAPPAEVAPPADPAPAAPAAPEPAPASAPGEVSEAMTGRPAAPSLQTEDGMSALIEGGSNGRKEVALTFDAGADRGYAEAILDLLRDEGVPATFGMTGSWAEANPDLIRRMVAEGHQLINHTWTHDSMTGANTGKPPMTFEELASELERTEQIIRDLTGYELAPYFRPPYGDYDATTLTWLKDLGYPYTIMWTCDTRGWAGWDARKIIDYCTSVPLEDDIILMHVGASAAGDYEALPGLIQYYRDNEYAFVTSEQMLQP